MNCLRRNVNEISCQKLTQKNIKQIGIYTSKKNCLMKNVYVVFRGGLPNVYVYLQGGRGGQKWPKSCLRNKSMAPLGM